MRTVAEHQDAIRDLLAPLRDRQPEPVPADAAASDLLDRVLATELRSPLDHPPFDNSQMDGYAVLASDVVPDRALAVGSRIAAGAPGNALPRGTASPIMTGAPIPAGADAVIPIEAAAPAEFQPEDGNRTVAFGASVQPGAFVRRRGSDLAEGQLLLAAGTRLGPAQFGVIAASGITEVDLVPRVRVLVVSTGDELERPGATLGPGRIYDANRASMASAVARAGGVSAIVETVTDDAAALTRLLAASAPHVDLVLTTGGVSKGAYEVVRDVFEPAGVRFASVAMQPGGPQGWGTATLDDRSGRQFTVPVVAFPGNPVSALVSFAVFLAPVLRELHGVPERRPATGELAAPLESPEGKHQVRRGRLDRDGRVELVGGASSHLLHGYATSTHLVHIPLGVSSLESGDTVEIWSIDD